VAAAGHDRAPHVASEFAGHVGHHRAVIRLAANRQDPDGQLGTHQFRESAFVVGEVAVEIEASLQGAGAA
jgi:hypothetical protein